MRGDLRYTWLFKTADGWTRRVLASTSIAAGMILAGEIADNQGYAYRHEESRPLDAFKLTDFVSCEAEHVET